MIKSLIIILLSNVIAGELYSSNLFEKSNRVPEANEVFALTANIEKQAAYITWEIRDGYYMYLDSIKLKYKDKALPFKMLESRKELYKDEFFGETEILRDEFIINGKLDITKYRPIARLGYKDYATISEVYELDRPK